MNKLIQQLGFTYDVTGHNAIAIGLYPQWFNNQYDDSYADYDTFWGEESPEAVWFYCE